MAIRARDLARWVRVGFWSCLFLGYVEIAQFARPRPQRPDLFAKVMGIWARRVLRPNAFSIEGAERIPHGEPLILVSNHQGYFDIPLLHALLPRPFRWMARHDLFRMPVVGPALRGSGSISVDREDRRAAAQATRAALDQLAAGHSLLIFAEGGWGDAMGRMLPFKKGVIALARRARVKVVPLTIVGSSDANPARTTILRPSPLRVVVHPPLGPSSWEGVDDDAWTARLREIIGGPLPYGTDCAVLEETG